MLIRESPKDTLEALMNGRMKFSLRLFVISMLSAIAVAMVAGVTRASGPAVDKPEMTGIRLLEPVTYENLSIFPVVTSRAAATGEFITLDEALASGAATVTERGSDTMHRTREGGPVREQNFQSGASVNQLVLINKGTKPLILLAGELVSGGKQDRIIGKDRIVPVGAEPLPLDVFCVEHGRWSSGANFSAGNLMVHPSVRESAAFEAQQTEVWNSVRNGTNAKSSGSAGGGGSGGGSGTASPRISSETLGGVMRESAPTASYDKAYNSSTVTNVTGPFVDEMQKRFSRATENLKDEKVIGVVIAYGGEVAWSDVFASADLFQRYWSKLLKSYVVEAVARPGSKERASLSDAQDFLRPLEGPEKVESIPNVYRWREVTQGHYAEIDLQSLKPADLLLHRLKIHRTS
jgi:hypothetical protein